MNLHRNLAGSRTSTGHFTAELLAAGLQVVPSNRPDGETRCSVDGFADLGGGFTLRVVRRWVYTTATCDPPLPAEAAVDVNGLPFANSGSHYSGTLQTLGAVARAHGYAGGMDDGMVREWGPCSGWDCDAIEALAALVAGLRKVIARRGITVEDGRREAVAHHTQAFLDEYVNAVGEDNKKVVKLTRKDLDGSVKRKAVA